MDLINGNFPEAAKGKALVVFEAQDGATVDQDPNGVAQVLADVIDLDHVAAVTDPHQVGTISDDGRIAYAELTLDVPEREMGKPAFTALSDGVSSMGTDDLRVELGGDAVFLNSEDETSSHVGIGLLAALLVLLIVFGTAVAAILPIGLSLVAVGAGIGAITLLASPMTVSVSAIPVAGLVGLGVGVDYALFIVTRYREALDEGADPEEATATAVATAGRSVVFAGTTVVVALLGLLVMRQRLLSAVAVAASLTVLMTMIAAVTLLPALLGFAGRRIDRFRVPAPARRSGRRPLSERWAGVIQRRPVIAGTAATLLLLVLAAPALSMRLSFSDGGSRPHDTSAYAAHRILASGFGPGYDAPLVFVSRSPATARAVATEVGRTPGIASVTPVRTSDDGAAAMFVAYPRTGLQDAATPGVVHRLRDTVVPRAGGGVLIGGPNAGTIDFSDSVRARLPWLIVVVVSLSLLLLLVLVRSVAIAVKAAVMNLLSIAAAYGVLTAVVQWGWLGHQLGFPSAMPVTPWVPLFMFPILFGLSTDYEVFLISRVREEYDRGAGTRTAVTRGLARTARVITAAAAIMVCVFLSVLLVGDIAVKQVGLGLGVAVLIDATVVRMVLVPAVMELLGRVNWWLPAWLARILPAVEPAPVPARTPDLPVRS
jgi:RND superfamily putative drug exporter